MSNSPNSQGHTYVSIHHEGSRKERVYKEIWWCISCGCIKTEESTGPSIFYWSLYWQYPGNTTHMFLESECPQGVAAPEPTSGLIDF